MDIRQLLEPIQDFSVEKFSHLLRIKCDKYQTISVPIDIEDESLHASIAERIGLIEFDDTTRLTIVAVELDRELTTRTGKKAQYEFAKRLLKIDQIEAGLFLFYDDQRHFRLSLVSTQYAGTRRTFSSFRRYTYYVSTDFSNKTFINQMKGASFSSLEAIQEAFSVEAVSDDFYNEFKPHFDELAEAVQGADDTEIAYDLALLFVIRILFLGFVQKKGWLGGDLKFIQHLWEAYIDSGSDDSFYMDWLSPLFFEALNSPPGRKVSFGDNKFPAAIEEVLQMAPYLNGELFKRKKGVDDKGLWIPDEIIGVFLDFLFQYNFTVEENTLYDSELELNPEFLGIIFERIVNKEDGAIYTPRVEVDFMCRMAVVKWLEQNSSCNKRDLYEFLFREGGTGFEYDDMQKQGDFSTGQIEELISLLESVTVCDPAAGSGAFEVGMLHILEESLNNLYERNNAPAEIKANKPTSFELRKAIIARSLYGAEVKRWAVWINQLRLWLTLFVDMPDDMKVSMQPLLPNLTFKVRCGDSLVQRIGSKTFPVHDHATLSRDLKRKVTNLKKKKQEFFYNHSISEDMIRHEETQLFRSILNEEIQRVEKQLKQIKQNSMDLSGQISLKAKDQRALEALEKEKEDLLGQSDILIESPPFIWSIEFAEVFFGKGGFDIIIGNPPYVSQVSIKDPLGHLTPKEYKRALVSMLEHDFDFFSSSEVKISGHSDLYTYFYVRSIKLLNRNGIHVFVCSNSWLDASYGTWLKHFLLRSVPVFFVFDNLVRRSFSAAQVNTVITVMGNSSERAMGETGASDVRFVALTDSFEKVMLTESLLKMEEDAPIIVDHAFRVVKKNKQDLLLGRLFQGTYEGDKWSGKYCRSPLWFLRILESDLTSVMSHYSMGGELPILRFGGYVHDNNTGKKFPDAPFIKNIREANSINLLSSDIRKYGVNPTPKARETADLLFARTYGQNHLVLLNTAKAIGKEFYKIFSLVLPKEELALYWNSTFVILQREVFGLANLGGGAIKFGLDDLKYFVFPKKLRKASLKFPQYEAFLSRPIKGIFEELGLNPEDCSTNIQEKTPHPLPDRKALDDIVFDALDLTDEERKDVYRAVCQLVWNRISKANSVKKRK